MNDDDTILTSTLRQGLLTILAAVVAILLVGSVVGSAGDVFGIFVNRKAVEQSLQYSTTNAEAFYTSLSAIKKIDVQLAGLAVDDPQIAPLRSQRAFLDGECRRAVAKIPENSRTTDMFPYSGGSL